MEKLGSEWKEPHEVNRLRPEIFRLRAQLGELDLAYKKKLSKRSELDAELRVLEARNEEFHSVVMSAACNPNLPEEMGFYEPGGWFYELQEEMTECSLLLRRIEAARNGERH